MNILKKMIPEIKDPDIPDETELKTIWEEELARTKQMFETIYHNMQAAKSVLI